jgi:phosphoribosyl 1,2-cyclic phosphate phosphodiesterase
MKLRLLGAGTSYGVPRIGNDWGVCDPTEPRNRRTRASVLVESDTTRILVDTSPDLREQLLAAQVGTVDAVIWTHDHADHTHGIDDLRQIYFATGRPVAGYARPATRAVLSSRFDYVVAGKGGYAPTVALDTLPDTLTIGDVAVRVVDQPHGSITSAGLRFEHDGKVAGYATDFGELTAEMRELYSDLDLWVVDALRFKPHPAHPSVPQVIRWVEELRPKRTILMHMDNSLDYATLCRELPAGIAPGYDGMEVVL